MTEGDSLESSEGIGESGGVAVVEGQPPMTCNPTDCGFYDAEFVFCRFHDRGCPRVEVVPIQKRTLEDQVDHLIFQYAILRVDVDRLLAKTATNQDSPISDKGNKDSQQHLAVDEGQFVVYMNTQDYADGKLWKRQMEKCNYRIEANSGIERGVSYIMEVDQPRLSDPDSTKATDVPISEETKSKLMELFEEILKEYVDYEEDAGLRIGNEYRKRLMELLGE